MGIEWFEGDALADLNEEKKKTFQGNYEKVVLKAKDLLPAKIDAPKAVNVSDFVDHIDYMVDLIGIDHVGISSDFDGGGGIEGWSDASETLNVTLELVRRGYTQEQITKLWGGNLLRVLDQVRKVAKDLGQS